MFLNHIDITTRSSIDLVNLLTKNSIQTVLKHMNKHDMCYALINRKIN